MPLAKPATHQPRVSAYRKKARSACAATETDLRLHPAAPFIARNSSTSSTLTRTNDRCRSPNQAKNFDVFQQCERTDWGESPCSSGMCRAEWLRFHGRRWLGGAATTG